MNVLVVCTGNTCRSPLAAALARRIAAERGLTVTVRSAGTHAHPGDPASPEAVRIVPELAVHRARRLTSDQVAWADEVLAMEPGHVAVVEALGGSARLLADDGVPDPLGGGDEAYEGCAETLERALREVLG